MKKYLAALFIISCLFVSCNRNKDEVIVFDNSHPLALAPDISWALVTDPYAAYKSQVGWDEQVTGHCRKGEILQILSKAFDSDGLEWYRFEEGWLPSSCLTVYSNRLRAENSAKNLQN